jgi:hypothetical protein
MRSGMNNAGKGAGIAMGEKPGSGHLKDNNIHV